MTTGTRSGMRTSLKVQIRIHMICIENRTCTPWLYAGLKCGGLDCTAVNLMNAMPFIGKWHHYL
jgi:hypothetical protein